MVMWYLPCAPARRREAWGTILMLETSRIRNSTTSTDTTAIAVLVEVAVSRMNDFSLGFLLYYSDEYLDALHAGHDCTDVLFYRGSVLASGGPNLSVDAHGARFRGVVDIPTTSASAPMTHRVKALPCRIDSASDKAGEQKRNDGHNDEHRHLYGRGSVTSETSSAPKAPVQPDGDELRGGRFKHHEKDENKKPDQRRFYK